jgi:tRNA nucleotidyltransferase (CCA-adding enzyme)
VGKKFPVFKLNISGKDCDVAFARRDKKVWEGHNGFEVYFSPDVTIMDDLVRRDTTMNSMAIDLDLGRIIDPFGGLVDISNKVIKATSKEFFSQDPVRALRVARQASQFGMTVDVGTVKLMESCGNELLDEPAERFFGELKLALQTKRPSVFFRILKEANLLKYSFPYIYLLIGKTQCSQYHPEGDAFEHTMQVLDEVAKSTIDMLARYCALMHDIGKGLTPAGLLPKHHNHDKTGIRILSAFKDTSCIPNIWYKSSKFVIRHHMRVVDMKQPKKIVQFLLELDKNPLSHLSFMNIIKADSHGIPTFLSHYYDFITSIKMINGKDAPSSLKGKEIGEWIMQQRCHVVSKLMKKYRGY